MMQMKMRSKMPASWGQHLRSHNSSINRFTMYYHIKFWKNINGFYCCRIKSNDSNFSTGINKVVNTVTLNHRRILSEARGAYIASPIFLRLNFSFYNMNRISIQKKSHKMLHIDFLCTRVKPWTTLFRRAFTVAGPTAWNSLPDYLRDPSLSEDTFRRLLKTYLFALY